MRVSKIKWFSLLLLLTVITVSIFALSKNYPFLDFARKPQTSILNSYESEKLKVRFTYPAKWGDPIEEDIPTGFLGTSPDTFVSFTNFTDSRGGHPIVLFGTEYTTQIPERGTFWGDSAREIFDEDYIRDYCSSDENLKDPGKVGVNCEVFINRNGIYIAKLEYTLQSNWAGLPIGKTADYYFYNPNSQLSGLAASYNRINDEMYGVDISQLEKEFEDFIQSLSFLE